MGMAADWWRACTIALPSRLCCLSGMSTIRQSKQYDTDDLPPRWGALLGVTAALAAFGAGQGLSYPLFTILMQRQEMSPVLIGLSAAMMPIGLITSAVFIPRLVAWFGARRLAVSCAIAAALCFLLVGALQNGIAWFVVRFLLALPGALGAVRTHQHPRFGQGVPAPVGVVVYQRRQHVSEF